MHDPSNEVWHVWADADNQGDIYTKKAKLLLVDWLEETVAQHLCLRLCQHSSNIVLIQGHWCAGHCFVLGESLLIMCFVLICSSQFTSLSNDIDKKVFIRG